MMKIIGKVHRFGENINTDVIYPAPYLNLTDPVEMGRHAMEGLDPDFTRRLAPGDIIVAGPNFGCGSSREHAPIALKAAGVGCVVASSFARIFYRNCINIGLPILECPQAAEGSEAGDELEIELSTGEVRNLTRGLSFQAEPFPESLLELISAGGLIEYTRQKLVGRVRG